MATRKIKRNQWGNICGYEGAKRVYEFGCDYIAAGYWYNTGIVDFLMGYEDENYQDSKEAAEKFVGLF